ncbi:MAG: hypothetical protein LBR19_06590 [Bifidobacteriaceae bacterium]|nr:hypothetical protein [Bifidobacteriaceae bacterium]
MDHDLPATLTELGDGSLVPTWDDTKANVVSTRALNGQQVTAYLGDDDSSDGAIFPRRDTAWGLVIDGVDYSEIYTECRASSGYIETWEQPGDPAEELVAKAETAAVSNDWARCARDNGWPEVADATAPVADGYETSPTVLLPITMTEDQLTALLEVCPLVADPVTGKKPSVYFDYDPMTTTYDQDERIWALTDILYAAQQADWEQEPAQ